MDANPFYIKEQYSENTATLALYCFNPPARQHALESPSLTTFRPLSNHETVHFRSYPPVATTKEYILLKSQYCPISLPPASALHLLEQ